MNDNISVIIRDNVSYPKIETLFFPSVKYPEYLFSNDVVNETNSVYDMIRENLKIIGLDIHNYGSAHWNPLGDIIAPGQTILIKPNMVMDFNPIEENLNAIITHPSLVKAIVDYVLIALKGTGKIFIGDAPMQSCDFDNLCEKSGYKKLLTYYQSKGYDNISLVDFRDFKSIYDGNILRELQHTQFGKIVYLNDKSEFSHFTNEMLNKLRITNYHSDSLKKYHSLESHAYCIAHQVLEADVVINMPKPKTHRKAGVTGALKNLVGITAEKTCLPHHTLGPICEKGDEYQTPNFLKKIVAKLWDLRNDSLYSWEKRIYDYGALLCSIIGKIIPGDRYTEGSWYGNDTIWRTILDLNKILIFANKFGIMCNAPQRKILTIADMIISGENEGPLLPTSKYVGTIIMGSNSVDVDKCICACMGFQWNKIPSIVYGQKLFGDGCAVFMDEKNNEISLYELRTQNINRIGKFKPTKGWENIL